MLAQNQVVCDCPIISDDPEVQLHYVECRKAGTSHSLAEMMALAQPPMSSTDREFLEGTENGKQFNGSVHTRMIGDRYKRMAARAGVSTTGKVYKENLALYPGDPEAWVSGLGDMDRVIRKRPGACRRNHDGKIVAQGPEPTPGPTIGLADDIVEAEVNAMVASSPEPVKESRQDLREKVRDKHTPQWKKKNKLLA